MRGDPALRGIDGKNIEGVKVFGNDIAVVIGRR